MDPRPARPARRSLAALLAVSLAAACGQVSPPPSPAGTLRNGTPGPAGPVASSSSIPATAPVASSSSIPATGPDQSITPSPSGPDAAIDVVASGIVAPVGLVTPPDGSGRSFVL